MSTYHAGVPHGLYPPGFHDGLADDCDDTACHGQPLRTDPAADLEVMLFDIATGAGTVMPGAAKAAIQALCATSATRGWLAAADWLRAEYTGPGADLPIRRAADRITKQAATATAPAAGEQPHG